MSDTDWERYVYKNNKVYVRTDETGRPVLDDRGLAVVRYRTGDDREYNVHPRDLIRLTPEVLEALERDREKKRRKTATIRIFTAGGAEAGDGPAGSGIVLLADGYRREISLYFPRATLSVAELVAVREALGRVRDRHRRVRLHVDSAHVLGVLTGDWKAGANRGLVEEIRVLMQSFTDLELVRVRSRRRSEFFDRADSLAAQARAEGRGTDDLMEMDS